MDESGSEGKAADSPSPASAKTTAGKKNAEKADLIDGKSGNVLDFKIGDLAPGESETFRVHATAGEDDVPDVLTIVAKATAKEARVTWATTRIEMEAASAQETGDTRRTETTAESASATAPSLTEGRTTIAEPMAAADLSETTALPMARSSEAAFEIETSSNVANATVGDTVRIVVRIRNVGNADARDVLVRSVIPKGMVALEESTTEDGHVDATHGFVEWIVPAIASKSWMECSYEATVVQACGAVMTQASCESDAIGKAGTAITLAHASRGIAITTNEGAAVETDQAVKQEEENAQDHQPSSATAIPKTGDTAVNIFHRIATALLTAALGAIGLERRRRSKIVTSNA